MPVFQFSAAASFSFVACVLWALPIRAGSDTTPEVAELRSLRAQTKLLKTQVARQKGEIAAMKEKIAQFEAKLAAAAGPIELPTTGPAAEDGRVDAARPRAAKRVVFVVDLSGSMIDKLSRVKEEVVKGVAGLRPDTTFNIVLAADEKVETFQPRPVAATPRAAADVHAYLMDVTSSGTSNMTSALELAIKGQRADLVWFITDGDMPNNDEFLRAVRAANRSGRTRINAVAATNGPIEKDDTSTSFVRVLSQLASENGGTCFDLTGQVVDPGSLPPAPPVRRTVGAPQPPGRSVGTAPPAGPGPPAGRKQRPPGFDPNDIPKGPSIFQE